MKREDAAARTCVLVGTYRPQNADWIRERKFYNLPLSDAADPSAYEKVEAIVLYAEDSVPLAYAAKYSRVVEKEWLKENGYSLAKVPHGDRYALFSFGEKTSVAKHMELV